MNRSIITRLAAIKFELNCCPAPVPSSVCWTNFIRQNKMEKKKKPGTKEFHRGLELSHHRDMWRQKKLWGQRSCPLCLVSRRPVTAWRTDPRDMDWRTVCCDTVTPNSSPGDYPGFKLPLPVKRRQSQLVKAPKIINTRSTVFSRVVLIWTVHSSLCHSVRGKKKTEQAPEISHLLGAPYSISKYEKLRRHL